MVGSGKYYLQPSYKHLSVPQSRWFAMAKEQTKQCLKRFNELAILAVSDRPNTSHSDSAVVVSLGDEPATQLSAVEMSSVSLSSDFETGNYSLHQITSDTSTPAPTSSQSICSLLSSKLSVLLSKLQYKSAKLRSHVAAAEHNKQLDAFIALYGAIKKTPNITKLATADVPKEEGGKEVKLPPRGDLQFLLRGGLNSIHPHWNLCPKLLHM